MERKKAWEEANAKAVRLEKAREDAVLEAEAKIEASLRWEPMPLAKEVGGEDKMRHMLGTASIRPGSAMETESISENWEGWINSPTGDGGSMSPSPEPQTTPGGNRTSFLKGIASAGKNRRKKGRTKGGGSQTPNNREEKKGGVRPSTAMESRQDTRFGGLDDMTDASPLEGPNPNRNRNPNRPSTALSTPGGFVSRGPIEFGELEYDPNLPMPEQNQESYQDEYQDQDDHDDFRDKKGSKPRWVASNPNPRIIEQYAHSTAYALKPNSYEQIPKFVDPNFYQQPMEEVLKMNEADRKSIPKVGKGGKYYSVVDQETRHKRERTRPASAYQTMTQMSGMYVKRAPGGVPEPVAVDVNARDEGGIEYGEDSNRPATAMGTRERTDLAEDLTIRGEDKARSGRWHKAIPEYSAALEVDKAYAPAYWRRGCSHWELGNYGAAIEDYNSLYKLDPTMSHSDSARKHKLIEIDRRRKSRPAWGAGRAAKRNPLTGLPVVEEPKRGAHQNSLRPGNAAPTA